MAAFRILSGKELTSFRSGFRILWLGVRLKQAFVSCVGCHWQIHCYFPPPLLVLFGVKAVWSRYCMPGLRPEQTLPPKG